MYDFIPPVLAIPVALAAAALVIFLEFRASTLPEDDGSTDRPSH